MEAVLDCKFGEGFENIRPVDYEAVKYLCVGDFIITFGRESKIKLKIIEKEVDLNLGILTLKCQKVLLSQI